MNSHDEMGPGSKEQPTPQTRPGMAQRDTPPHDMPPHDMPSDDMPRQEAIPIDVTTIDRAERNLFFKPPSFTRLSAIGTARVHELFNRGDTDAAIARHMGMTASAVWVHRQVWRRRRAMEGADNG